MRQLKIGFAAFSLLVLLAAHSVEAAQIYLDPLYGVQVSKNVQYGWGATSKGPVPLYCDIYQPINIGLAPVLINRPAVVIQDGGAWASATKERGRVIDPAMYNAARGFTAIVTDYRQGAPTGGDNLVQAVNGSTIFGSQPYNGVSIPFIYQIFPGTSAIRAGIEDFAVAINYVRTNASLYNIDPNRIGIAGGSAGGIDAILMQYANNNNPINPAYTTQAVVGLVASTYGNSSKIKPGGPPVFLLNNTSDPVVPWESAMPAAFNKAGIYTEQWFQKTQVNHDVDWNEILVDGQGVGKTARQRVNEFLAYRLAGGPVLYVVPEPASLALGLMGFAAFGLICRARRRQVS